MPSFHKGRALLRPMEMDTFLLNESTEFTVSIQSFMRVVRAKCDISGIPMLLDPFRSTVVVDFIQMVKEPGIAKLVHNDAGSVQGCIRHIHELAINQALDRKAVILQSRPQVCVDYVGRSLNTSSHLLSFGRRVCYFPLAFRILLDIIGACNQPDAIIATGDAK